MQQQFICKIVKFQQLTLLCPQPESTCKRNVIFPLQGYFGDAILHYTRCIELCPSMPSSYSNRALCHIRMGKVSHCRQISILTMPYHPDSFIQQKKTAQPHCFQILRMLKCYLEDHWLERWVCLRFGSLYSFFSCRVLAAIRMRLKIWMHSLNWILTIQRL